MNLYLFIYLFQFQFWALILRENLEIEIKINIHNNNNKMSANSFQDDIKSLGDEMNLNMIKTSEFEDALFFTVIFISQILHTLNNLNNV